VELVSLEIKIKAYWKEQLVLAEREIGSRFQSNILAGEREVGEQHEVGKSMLFIYDVLQTTRLWKISFSLLKLVSVYYGSLLSL